LIVTAMDSQGHALTYAWTAACPTLAKNGNFDDPGLSSPSWTAPANPTPDPQSCTLAVTVSDGQGLHPSASYTQIVAPSASPPPTAPPALIVELNQLVFRPGDKLIATITLLPGTEPLPVDAYIVIQVPDGSVLSLQLAGVVPGVVPVATIVPRRFTGQLRYTFTGREQLGVYSWFTTLTEPGSAALIGTTRKLAFVLNP
jgi:hypothetical protein